MTGSCYAYVCMKRASRQTRPDPAQARRERLACLADPSRFHIIETLAAGERFVSDLAQAIGLSQSCTTRHLQALARHGLVAGRRRGRRVMFSLRDVPETRIALEASAAALRRWPAAPDTRARRPRRGAAREPAVPRTTLAPVQLMEHVEAVDAPPASRAASAPMADDAPGPAGDGSGPDGRDPDAPGPRRPPARSTELEDFLL